ncbi:MAG TPA: hypothetical protein PKC42_04560, partial [Candidatus Nanoperiomorbaceae bacterium]|nr:hypothetical protein [Candidatus Nanoperiomorbaceae bacterium]
LPAFARRSSDTTLVSSRYTSSQIRRPQQRTAPAGRLKLDVRRLWHRQQLDKTRSKKLTTTC